MAMSWREKLETIPKNRIVSIPAKWRKRFGTGKMLIPRPREVDALMKKPRKGRLLTLGVIRTRLARVNRVKAT